MAWTGATGAGVIVGVVDDGLDFRHPDFLNADGTTRLLSLWDMRAAARGTDVGGAGHVAAGGDAVGDRMADQVIQCTA